MISPWCDFLAGPSLSAAPNCPDAAQSCCARAKPSWCGETVRLGGDGGFLLSVFQQSQYKYPDGSHCQEKGYLFINIEYKIKSHQKLTIENSSRNSYVF